MMKTVTRAGVAVVAGCLLVALLAGGFSSEAKGRAEAPAAAKRAPIPPRMRVLAWRNGVWDQVTTVKPSKWVPQGSTTKGVSTTGWVLGGKFQQTNHANRPGSPDAIFVVMYDAKIKAYRGLRIDDEGNSMQATGTWDKAKRTLTWTWQDDNGNRFVAPERFVDKNTITSEGVGKSREGERPLDIRGKMARKKAGK